jgi:hypothetical protein
VTTTAVNRLLKELTDRHKAGQCYMIRRPREAFALYGPVLPRTGELEPVTPPFRRTTVHRAHLTGDVDLGTVPGEMPAPLQRAVLRYERSGEVFAYRIALVNLGGQDVTGLVTMQTGLGYGEYALHLVRSTATGTPGPALCGLDRFGPDAPGWDLRGGTTGPDVTQRPCISCLTGATLRYPAMRVTGIRKLADPINEELVRMLARRPSPLM